MGASKQYHTAVMTFEQQTRTAAAVAASVVPACRQQQGVAVTAASGAAQLIRKYALYSVCSGIHAL
eukprot:9571-Heterococcus_DN1.PRE.2